MPTVYLGLGANLGDREANLRAARERLQELGVELERCSSLYESEPWGVRDQPRFLNAVCRAHTALSPQELLRLAKQVERDLGRVVPPRSRRCRSCSFPSSRRTRAWRRPDHDW